MAAPLVLRIGERSFTNLKYRWRVPSGLHQSDTLRGYTHVVGIQDYLVGMYVSTAQVDSMYPTLFLNFRWVTKRKLTEYRIEEVTNQFKRTLSIWFVTFSIWNSSNCPRILRLKIRNREIPIHTLPPAPTLMLYHWCIMHAGTQFQWNCCNAAGRILHIKKTKNFSVGFVMTDRVNYCAYT